jgi:hypothetical protein
LLVTPPDEKEFEALGLTPQLDESFSAPFVKEKPNQDGVKGGATTSHCSTRPKMVIGEIPRVLYAREHL